MACGPANLRKTINMILQPFERLQGLKDHIHNPSNLRKVEGLNTILQNFEGLNAILRMIYARDAIARDNFLFKKMIV